MPRTVDEGFRDFLKKLTPSSVESEAAKKHRQSIESCLKSNFNIQRFFRSGSFGNGTSISSYSDVDFFASYPSDQTNDNSSRTMVRTREALAKRFSLTTGIRVNCPAIYVPFGSLAKDDTEVVPAEFYTKTSSDHKVYKIADCAGGWRKSSPDAHNSYVRRVDNKLSNKLKPLIRFIKAWKYYRNVPLSSFYLELRATKYADGEDNIVYDIDVKRILQKLSDANLAQMQDPMGISGYISPSATSAQLEDAKSKLKTALSRADKAVQARTNGDIKSTFGWWDLVFNGQFPSYYR